MAFEKIREFIAGLRANVVVYRSSPGSRAPALRTPAAASTPLSDAVIEAQLDEFRRRVTEARQVPRIDLADLLTPGRGERDRGIYEYTPEMLAATFAEIAERERALQEATAMKNSKWRYS